MIRRHWLTWVLVGVLILVVGIGLLVKFGMEKAQADEILAKFPDRGVPRMNITLNGVTLEEINAGSKETKYEGNEVAVYEGSEKINEYDGVEVKGRGNTTWNQDKKPSQIKFNQKVDLFGMGKRKKWVLLANAFDITSLRNDTAMLLAEMVGMQYNKRGKFLELYIDDEYNGLYYLMQKVEIDKASVDLRRSDGLLFEIDMLHTDDGDTFISYLGDFLVLKDSVLNDYGDMVKSFMFDYNNAERAIIEKNYSKITKIIDIDSFAEYYLINEFAANPDAYSTSFYLYRNNEGKIAAGPVWDFDLAFANKEWVWHVDERLFSPYEEMVKKKEAFGFDGSKENENISKIFYYLMEIPEFREKVSVLFQDRLCGRKDELVKAIMTSGNTVNMAVLSNNTKWNKTFSGEEYLTLIEWVEARYDYFERVYGGEANVLSE